MSGSVSIVDQNNNQIGTASAPLYTQGSGAPYLSTQTPITASSGVVGNATAYANLTGGNTTTVYLAGFEVTGGGATAATVANVTVTGTISGNLSYVFGAPLGAGVPAQPLTIEFNPPIPASAVNTPISISVGALGTGNTKAAVTAHGFYQ